MGAGVGSGHGAVGKESGRTRPYLAFFLPQHGEMKAGRRAEKGSSLNASQGEAQGGKVLFKLKDAVGTRINRRKLDVSTQVREFMT